MAENETQVCVGLDAGRILKAGPRSFVLTVRGQSMANAGICDGDLVIGDFIPEASPGAIVVALIDGESTLKRIVIESGKPQLVSENPNRRAPIFLDEVVIQGRVHTLVRRLR